MVGRMGGFLLDKGASCRRSDSGSVSLSRTSRASIWTARTFSIGVLDARAGSGMGREGREVVAGGRGLKYPLGPDRCLGAKAGVVRCELAAAIGP